MKITKLASFSTMMKRVRKKTSRPKMNYSTLPHLSKLDAKMRRRRSRNKKPNCAPCSSLRKTFA